MYKTQEMWIYYTPSPSVPQVWQVFLCKLIRNCSNYITVHLITSNSTISCCNYTHGRQVDIKILGLVYFNANICKLYNSINLLNHEWNISKHILKNHQIVIIQYTVFCRNKVDILFLEKETHFLFTSHFFTFYFEYYS